MWNALFGNSKRQDRPTRQQRLHLLTLEDRIVPSMVFWVTNTDDAGGGSLRQAIEDANDEPGADVIRFARDVRGTIGLTSGELKITDSVTVQGPGANKLTVSGNDESRAFHVESGSVTIADLTVTRGLADVNAPFLPGAGGGILNQSGADLNLSRVVLADNRAVGDPNVVITLSGVLNEAGAGVGGGVLNLGTLTVSRSTFTGNQALGADNTDTSGSSFPAGPAFAGHASGGAIGNYATASVRGSTFTDNLARAGNFGKGDFAGIGVAGAIYNDFSLTISGSSFNGNQAIGGDENESPFHNGHGLGGAVTSGSLLPLVGGPGATLGVSRSTFSHNQAIGGNDNVVTLPPDEVPPADGPNNGYGGGILVYQGTASIERTDLRNNEAVGGAGGADSNGSLGVGGGVFFFSFLGAVEATVNGGTIEGNLASGDGGAGIGGGIAAGTLGAPFGVLGETDIRGTRFLDNQAFGGIGGGIYNEGDLTVRHALLSGNEAIGKADVRMTFVPGYVFQGTGLGGGLSNLGTVNVIGTTFDGNRAVGADDVEGPNFFVDGAVTYPGIAVGGGLQNLTEATVRNSRFVGNVAQAGSGNSGTFAGNAGGGGIYNDGSLVVGRSSFQANRAIAGDDNTADVNAGDAYGGGIMSGSVTALVGVRSASLVVEHSSFRHNEAVGGDGNTVDFPFPFPVPDAHGPGGAFGGGIEVYQGTAAISHSSLTRNRAVGGEGGIGAGGGVFFLSFIGSVDAQLSRSLVAHNAAIGGDGGDGIGGGIGSGSLGSLFGAPGTLAIDRSLVAHNLAEGGTGGDGLGGGIFNDTKAILELRRSLVFRNRAQGGPGGEGVGGGLYNLGTAEILNALIFANFASTSDDDCFGC